ncbi:MAG: branched-chain amino acid ABC transporter permease [Rhodospirillales bacterium]|nr:branched-chain amino acid ABC transporter permease [Rhodospirillales bacterium]MDP7100823.1 branched-chain amino acid ABC transporter permease [Rhodospirillales bacterium]MDP7425821.1 branched-chain amino acid ABC transporter permease [Rhodospirillales bacterium]|tara:strand:- start:274 stop:1236 length:963 start_codon:yes stop_codon:yes gene_type:complete
MNLAILRTPRGIYNSILILLCIFMPFIAPVIGQEFFTDVFARIMIMAIAAISLNMIMGYGGMISFGHAVFIGLGGYTVGIFASHGIESAYIQWPVGILVSGIFALIIGAISLRTRGVYFIMITLAFAQMIYFLSVSVEKYGSDDGLTIEARSDFGISFFDLNDALTMYYSVFVLLVGCLYLSYRIVNSRFGRVMRAAKSNDERMHTIGYPTFGYKLTAFVIAGMMGGLSGLLSANFEDFVSPDMMSWPVSGELIFMVVLGGMGTIMGPLGGTVIFLLLSEILSNITEAWHLIFGPFLILVVLFARGGVEGFFAKFEKRHD